MQRDYQDQTSSLHCCAGAIVGISCGILVLLFLGQSVGTSKLGHAFAPVLVLFFLSNAAVGIYNIVRYGYSYKSSHAPQVLPHHDCKLTLPSG